MQEIMTYLVAYRKAISAIRCHGGDKYMEAPILIHEGRFHALNAENINIQCLQNTV